MLPNVLDLIRILRKAKEEGKLDELIDKLVEEYGLDKEELEKLSGAADLFDEYWEEDIQSDELISPEYEDIPDEFMEEFRRYAGIQLNEGLFSGFKKAFKEGFYTGLMKNLFKTEIKKNINAVDDKDKIMKGLEELYYCFIKYRTSKELDKIKKCALSKIRDSEIIQFLDENVFKYFEDENVIKKIGENTIVDGFIKFWKEHKWELKESEQYYGGLLQEEEDWLLKQLVGLLKKANETGAIDELFKEVSKAANELGVDVEDIDLDEDEEPVDMSSWRDDFEEDEEEKEDEDWDLEEEEIEEIAKKAGVTINEVRKVLYEKKKKGQATKCKEKYYNSEEGHFKGRAGSGERFDNCVKYQMNCNGKSKESAEKICGKIARNKGYVGRGKKK